MACLFTIKRDKRNRTVWRSEALLLGIFLLLDQSCGTMFPSQLHLDPNTRGLRDLTVVVGKGLEGSCKEVVESVRRALTSASRSLHADLQGKLKLDTVTVQVFISPTWSDHSLKVMWIVDALSCYIEMLFSLLGLSLSLQQNPSTASGINFQDSIHDRKACDPYGLRNLWI